MSDDKARKLAELKEKQMMLRDQQRECTNKASSTDEKIKRLKEARNKMSDCKTAIGSLSVGGYDMDDPELNNAPGMIDDRWFGDKRESFENTRLDSLCGSLDKYYKGLDNILDDMNNKINDLQKSQFENEGVLGDIKCALYDIATKIQNCFD